jgi:hypothetical protein
VPSSAPSAIAASSVAAAPARAPSASAPAPVASTQPSPSSTTGDVTLPPSAVGHRIFVDGRVVGEGAATLHLPCGVRTIRIGSGGSAQTVDVPCGGAVALSRR